MRQEPAAASNGKDGWDESHVAALTSKLDLLQATEIFGILFGKRVQAENNNRPIDSMEAGRLDHVAKLGHLLNRTQPTT